jgi:hypothetical protein
VLILQQSGYVSVGRQTASKNPWLAATSNQSINQ